MKPLNAPASPCAYQAQDSQQTLREALEEYRRVNAAVLDEPGEEAAAFFQSHDVCHVIFGCDTSIGQEAAVDTWSMMGTDVPLREYLSYLARPEAVDILRRAGYGRVARESLAALPHIARVMRNARRMHKKWPWTGHEAYLDRTLASLRAEFGIRLVDAASD